MRWAPAASLALPAAITPRLVVRPRLMASASVREIGPGGSLAPGTYLAQKLPPTRTEVVRASTPAGEVLCSTETEPVGLVRPDCGKIMGRAPLLPALPGGAWADSRLTAAGISVAKHAARMRRG